jgi:hypothetical protein
LAKQNIAEHCRRQKNAEKDRRVEEHGSLCLLHSVFRSEDL